MEVDTKIIKISVILNHRVLVESFFYSNSYFDMAILCSSRSNMKVLIFILLIVLKYPTEQHRGFASVISLVYVRFVFTY